MKKFNPCLIIPCYEKHADALEATIINYLPYNIDIIVCDDGSSSSYQLKIKEICLRHNLIHIRNEDNCGKGGATKRLLLKALELGYDHGIQIDSDGQHDHRDLEKLLSLSKQYPDSLVSGRPLYDDSVPKIRYYSRYLTHFWVWVETLSFKLKDSMCGVRSYPLKITCDLIVKESIGNFMDFDTEIMVKLYWQGVSIRFVKIRVDYPENGVSYFRGFDDNVLITKMHTRLFFQMIPRIPALILRNTASLPWHHAAERGGLFFIWLTGLLIKLLGIRITYIIGRFVALFYLLIDSNLRQFSREYLIQVESFFKTKRLSIVSHLFSFTDMFVDKFAVWMGKIELEDINSSDVEKLLAIKERNEGVIFLSSHFGNIDISRALGQRNQLKEYYSLIFTKNSKSLFRVLKALDSNVIKNVIAVENFGPDVAMKVSTLLDEKKWVFLMADRTTSNSQKNLKVSFLGKDALISIGPFLLCYLIKKPVYSYHVYKEGRQFRIALKEITPKTLPERSQRLNYLEQLSSGHFSEVEKLVEKHPLQWFNFYKYWI